MALFKNYQEYLVSSPKLRHFLMIGIFYEKIGAMPKKYH